MGAIPQQHGGEAGETRAGLVRREVRKALKQQISFSSVRFLKIQIHWCFRVPPKRPRRRRSPPLRRGPSVLSAASSRRRRAFPSTQSRPARGLWAGGCAGWKQSRPWPGPWRWTARHVSRNLGLALLTGSQGEAFGFILVFVGAGCLRWGDFAAGLYPDHAAQSAFSLQIGFGVSDISFIWGKFARWSGDVHPFPTCEATSRSIRRPAFPLPVPR